MTLNDIKARLNLYEKLMRLDKPIGILLLLWPTLWGLSIACGDQPKWAIIWIFIIGTTLMRSAGCVVNDYADKDFDKHVARTKERPMAAGRVSTREALILAAVLALTAFLLILPLNRLTLWMSIPALFLAATYPYTKRFLPIPQAYLGIAFSFGIPMAFAAVLGKVPLLAWELLVANLFWVVGYDTAYAMTDKPDDLKIGIKTSAITFGRFDAAAVIFCYALFIVAMAAIGWAQKVSSFWYLGLGIASMLMALHYEPLMSRDREKCFRIFLSNNYVGAAVFIGIALDSYFHPIPLI
jgi:4-hydroxybenzoate polyprenyltransferase